MGPVDEFKSADEPLPVIPVAAQPLRFCSGCGQPWDAGWVECPVCIARRGHSATVAQAEKVFDSDRRNVRSATTLYFTLLGVSIFSMIVLLATGKRALFEVEAAATVAISVIVLIWCCFSARVILPLLLRLPSPLWILVAGVMAFGTMIVASGVVSLLNRATGMPVIPYLKTFTDAGYGFDVAVLFVCVLPAVFEELGFRGVILSALEPVLGPREALIVSALMFAILHLSIPSIPHLFLMGVLFAWLRQKTGSLYAGMVAHFTHNLLVLLAERHGSFLPW